MHRIIRKVKFSGRFPRYHIPKRADYTGHMTGRGDIGAQCEGQGLWLICNQAVVIVRPKVNLAIDATRSWSPSRSQERDKRTGRFGSGVTTWIFSDKEADGYKHHMSSFGVFGIVRKNVETLFRTFPRASKKPYSNMVTCGSMVRALIHETFLFWFVNRSD